MVIKEPTLSTLPPIHKEQIFLSYALEISQGINIKNLSRIGIKSVQNYLRAAAYHATDNGQLDLRLRYTPSGLPLDSAKPFPILRQILSHISNWADVRYEDLPLNTANPQRSRSSFLIGESLLRSGMYLRRHLSRSSNGLLM